MTTFVDMMRSARGRSRARAYHHGDLKAALVEGALEILRTEGTEALTLRGLARHVGVSQAAPYRHFTDRRQLFAAVAERGFERLQAAMLESMGSTTGRPGLRQVAYAYVQFALANPAEYRLMFGSEVANTEDLPSLRQTGRSVLGFVAEGIRQLQIAGLVGEGDPMLLAITTWSTLHGLVMLTLDGQTADLAPDVDVMVEQATNVLMFGLARRDNPEQR